MNLNNNSVAYLLNAYCKLELISTIQRESVTWRSSNKRDECFLANWLIEFEYE